jgi:hypothetical protein
MRFFGCSPRPPWPFTRRRVGLRGKRRPVRRPVTRSAAPSWASPRLRSSCSAPAAKRRAEARRPAATSRGIRRGHPSVDIAPMRPLPPDVAARLRAPGSHPGASRSALVVSHHLGGLLRIEGRGLVASRCRPWGSPRFRTPCPPGRSRTERRVPFPATQNRPPKNSPRRQPRRVTTAVAPLPFDSDDRDGLRSAEADPHTALRRPDRHRCRPDRAEVAGRLRGFAPPTSP